MTKVVAPLGSFSASGKIGKALVYFTHLGRNVVRGLVTPANPKTEAQGDSRLLLGALGRMTRSVVNPSDFYNTAVTLVPSGQTWVSDAIKRVISAFGSGATGVAALNAAFDGHSASNWQAQAVSVGLTDFTISYAASGEQTISAGAQLYALAVYAMQLAGSNPSTAPFDGTPYTTALASWASSDVVLFVADIQSVA